MPVGPRPPPEKSGISPHPQFLSLWQASSFLGRQDEQEGEAWVAMVGQPMTWSGGVRAWMREGEDWAEISLAHPSPVGQGLGQGGWQMASF